MKKSKEEERKNRRVTAGAQSRPGSSSTSDSKLATKQKQEKKNTVKQSFINKERDVNQLYQQLLKFSKNMNICDDMFPFLDEYGDPFTKKQDDGKLYTCPEISEEILPKEEWMLKIQEYIKLVQESDPILAAVLAVKSLNPKEKADKCLSVVVRFLTNIIENPENDKYRHVRCQNPIVESKVLSTDGALLLLGNIGFQLDMDNDLSESYLSFNQSHYHLKEVIKLINNVKGFQLTAFEEEETDQGRTCSDGSRESDNFYKLTSKDLKKNQQLRALEIEKESQLRTKSTREKEKRLIPKSKFTKIRVRTPDGKVLESTFEITDKLLQVYNFIDQNVTNGKIYTLFMPPATPFKDSDKGRTLAELQLFPAVLLTLKWDKKVNKGKKVIQ